MLNAVDVRRRRILGGVSVAFGVLLVVLAVMALTGSLGATTKAEPAAEEMTAASADGSGSSSDSGESSPPPETSTAPPTTEAPPAEKLPLTVLNAGGVSGLAAAGQAAFEAQQWPISEIGNYPDEAPGQSTVYFPAGDPAAQASAELLVSQFPNLVAAPAPEGFSYTGLVVVLTGDWQPGE